MTVMASLPGRRGRPEDAAIGDGETLRWEHVVDPQILEFAEIGGIVSWVAAAHRFGVDLLLGGEFASCAGGRERSVHARMLEQLSIVPGHAFAIDRIGVEITDDDE